MSKIYVTQPELPPLDEVIPLLQKIWDRRVLTNGGPFHVELERALAEYLGVKHLSLFNNGTIALITALKAAGLKGEVITTPYSFVATAHALVLNGLQPVFADIDPVTCNLSPAQFEAAITPHTTAVLPVHCYGTPCDVEAIECIAAAHGLKVIYDGAHAFGVRYRGRSVLEHGNHSVVSFHATKVFNTFEGGAVVSADAESKLLVDRLKNFGFVDEVTVMGAGTNGKMNEFQAAIGLVQLTRMEETIERRGAISRRYVEALSNVRGITCLSSVSEATQNHSYFPILVGSEFPLSRDELYQKMHDLDVVSRRYFYPLISSMAMYRDLQSAQPANLPVATRIAQQVLCLPIYPGLSATDVDRIIGYIARH